MDIGNRLLELRQAKGLSQGDIADRSGLLRHHVSRVENGRNTPSLPLLERWAAALEVELYQLFFVGDGQPEATAVSEKIPIGAQERTLLGLYGKLAVEEKKLLISVAREMVKRICIRG